MARAHTYQGTTLPYRLFVPENYVATKQYPLVVALHGAGERGSDNLIHIRSYRLATAWADPVNQARYPCFVVAPQCPLNRSWDADFGQPITPELATVNNLVDALSHEFSIDTNRLYVTGLSMGGFGVWDLITRFPNRFAAAIPLSAGFFPEVAASIAQIPIWNFHGALDDVVPVSFSREMIAALEQAGQTAVYTDCRYRNCDGLPDSLIAKYVASHANLFYTEFETGRHDASVFSGAYDYPFLFPWVFSKYKTTPGAITLTNLRSHHVLSSAAPIRWNAITPNDSVEIWFSPDAGENWQLVVRSAPSTGEYLWNTTAVSDCAFGLVKIFLKNAQGFIYSQAQSSYFTINNAVNATPFVKILNREFDIREIFEENNLPLKLWIGDAETNPLMVELFYSLDNGRVFTAFDNYNIVSDTVSQSRTIDLAALPNAPQAVIKVEVSDGNTSSADQTYFFNKRTARQIGAPATHVAGNSGAAITVQIVDPSQLTGQLYRITFNISSPNKSYNILNVDRGATVVENATPLDGTTESPQFDGLRLLVKDFDPAEIDREHTGWTIGNSTLNVAISLPIIIISPDTLRGFAQPADYKITFFDHVVDTSSTAFGATATPMKFWVQNLIDNRQAEVIFLDNNGDQTISPTDEIFILEPDPQGKLRLAWSFQFSGTPQDILPKPGEAFVFKTLKPVTNQDIYEFRGALTTVRENESAAAVPKTLTLYPNYPNPFGSGVAARAAGSPTTMIRYYLPQAEWVKLAIFNVLGQEVITLMESKQNAGFHALSWNGRNQQGREVGSGVYFYKIVTGDRTLTRKMILLR
ncbi:MAG: hypothetical protein ALAOOOJD_00872 [bacterium]|nr:hypothetical protein [bacterium]